MMMEFSWHDLPELIALTWAVLFPALMWTLSRTFARRADLEELKQRVDKSEGRFVTLEKAITDATQAATKAVEAAERIQTAADKLYGFEVQISDLRGDISTLEATLEPVKHFNQLMVEGHMKMGNAL